MKPTEEEVGEHADCKACAPCALGCWYIGKASLECSTSAASQEVQEEGSHSALSVGTHVGAFAGRAASVTGALLEDAQKP